MRAPGQGRFPIGYPGQPIAIHNPQPYPGGVPWHPVGYPPFPGGPGIPIVMNPSPFPGTTPTSPGIPLPNPDTPPTIPVGHPKPAPTSPGDDSTSFWSPWPLPPRGNRVVDRSGKSGTSAGKHVLKPRSSRLAERNRAVADFPGHYDRSQQATEDTGLGPNEDLIYRGGRIIHDLSYVNLYVSGDTEWSAADVERIDRSLSAAMRDRNLNNVLLQYYENQSISSTALPSHPLTGYTPRTVTRGDLQNYAAYLHQQGFLDSYDLGNTVFNFLLPPGTVLTVESQAANSVGDGTDSLASAGTFETYDIVPESEEGDSLSGLAGYHGSVVVANGGRVYYSVSAYSERFTDGATNGIPVFAEPWKNVAATLYHQLVEARTNPDVEDAIRDSNDLNADRNLGWVSDGGREIGDFPLHSNIPLTSVVTEVPLADGSGRVPVQLPYSNFVHGPEGPIPQPHPLPSR